MLSRGLERDRPAVPHATEEFLREAERAAREAGLPPHVGPFGAQAPEESRHERRARLTQHALHGDVGVLTMVQGAEEREDDRRRSEERRVGKEWVRTCRSRGSPY